MMLVGSDRLRDIALLVARVLLVPRPHRPLAFPRPRQAGQFVDLARDADRVVHAAAVGRLDDAQPLAERALLVPEAIELVAPVFDRLVAVGGS